MHAYLRMQKQSLGGPVRRCSLFEGRKVTTVEEKGEGGDLWLLLILEVYEYMKAEGAVQPTYGSQGPGQRGEVRSEALGWKLGEHSLRAAGHHSPVRFPKPLCRQLRWLFI